MIQPGKSVCRLTRLYVLRGGASEALERYKRDRDAGSIRREEEAVPPRTAITKRSAPPSLPLSLRYVPLDISRYANRGFIDEVANDGKGGWSDQGPDCDLREFPAGLQRFNGIPFLVGKEPRACIVLRSLVRPFPEAQPEAVTLPVGRRTMGFWFLHAGTYTGFGQQVGGYRVQYADGTAAAIPLVGGVNLRDWIELPMPFTTEQGTWSRNAWTGSTRVSFPNVTVSQMLWLNPKPDVTVTAVTFENPQHKGCPILIALTAVEKGRRSEAKVKADHARAEDLLAKGRAAFDAGKNSEAKGLLVKALAAQPALEEGHRLLVATGERMQDEAGVLAACRAWVDAGATTVEPYNRMGAILERKGDLKEALYYYRQSFREDWSQVPVIRAKARLKQALEKAN